MTGMKARVALGRVLSHDNSACIVVDGELITAIATERLTGHKHDHSHNDLAIRYCLDAAGLTIDDVDVIVQNSPKHYFRSGSESAYFQDGDPRVYTVSHHLAHAWAVWATSPFDEAAIVVVDGRGNFVPPERDIVLPPGKHKVFDDGWLGWQIEVESIYRADKNGVRLIAKHTNRGLPASIGARFSRQDGLYPGEYSGYYQYAGLGALYEQVSRGLFSAPLDGGKVMGLAAYATPNPANACRMLVPDGEWPPKLGIQWLFDVAEPVPVSERFSEAAQLAADVQLALEEGMEALARRARELTGCANLCLTGGVALNCRANDRLHRAGIFDKIFVQPTCNDAGASLGCAYYGYVVGLGGEITHQRYHDFRGRSYDAEVPSVLQRWDAAVECEKVKDTTVAAAKLLDAGLVIGWYRGGSEFGPRALGHRSILALPGDAAVRERLNREIKRREPFRPFAPVVTAEAATAIFDFDGESPYMLRTVPVRPKYREMLAAVTHVDGTARVQTVALGDNPVLHALLERISEHYGLPVLLNTSLNTAGFPIVETPEDAILCLLSSGLDALVFDGWVARRRFEHLDALRTFGTPVRWRLLPDVVVRTTWRNGEQCAELARGPRRCELSPSEARLVLGAVELDDLAAQLDLAASLEVEPSVLDALLREGWALGERVNRGARYA